MRDADLVQRITELVAEEHRLESGHTGEGVTGDTAERLREIEVALDQLWDLLRQRRARRRGGEDPEDASFRPERVVEGYEQ